MDAAFEFSFNSLNMEFAINLAADGHSIPDMLFVDIMTEKCQLLHQHIKALKDCLMLVANIGRKMATIKLLTKTLQIPSYFTSPYPTSGIWRNSYIDYGSRCTEY